METIFKTLNEVQTEILVWGNPWECNGLDVIVCITGNPGIPDFYIEFGNELHKNTGLPVCVVGHAGHVNVPDKASNILENNERLFGLKGQLRHKLDLINNNIDKNSRIHFIGHSIGAWLVLETLHVDPNLVKRTASINLLCPTIQKMAASPYGKKLNMFIRKVNFIVILLVSLVYLLPECIIIFLITLYLKIFSLPSHYDKRIQKYVDPSVVEKVLFMAYEEMDNVVDLNKTVMNNVKHLTNVIYTSNDGWAPVNYMEDLKEFQPELNMKQANIDHAFVLKQSEKVAEMVSEFIKLKM